MEAVQFALIISRIREAHVLAAMLTAANNAVPMISVQSVLVGTA